jgi:hypothetical protein
LTVSTAGNDLQSSLVKLVGRKPPPRVLLFGPMNDTLTEAFSELFPTVASTTTLHGVRQAEWDLLITVAGVPTDLEPHMFVVAFGSRQLGVPAENSDFAFARSWLEPDNLTYSTEFVIPDGLPQPVALLTEQQLIPVITGKSNWVIVETHGTGQSRRHGSLTPTALQPFLKTPDGEILAGSFRRDGNKAECWSLPSGADPVAWVLAALEQWRGLAPDRFPGGPDWHLLPEWQTPQERELLARVAELEIRVKQTITELDQQHRDLDARLSAAREQATRRERVLVTGQGDALKGAVADCLAEIGFSVRDMDEVFPEGDRREDHRVQTNDWTAISEVRGYKDGAKSSDLLRLGRFEKRYVKDEGKHPDAAWYIVNQFKDREPHSRDVALRSQPDDLAAFAEDAGLVIDTRDLLRLWLAVQSSQLPPDDARHLLTDAVGLFRFPTS